MAEEEKWKRLAQKIAPQSRLIRVWELKGGVSAQVTAIEIERPYGHTQKMVVRRHGAVDRRQNPDVATDEVKLLQLLQAVGLPAPAPFYVDQSGEIFSTPYVVIEYIEGSTEFAPSSIADCIPQLATQLSRIHHVDCSTVDLSFLPRKEDLYTETLRERPAIVDESLDEGRIREILESTWPLPKRNRSVLLHGDFWPGNILWKDGRLVAVIDWEDAGVGDPLVDLANSRLEMLWAFGFDAMRRFTDHYVSLTSIDCTNLPYWDLCAALRPAFKIAEWAGNEVAERRMREGHGLFVTQAFEKMSGE